MEEEIKQTEIRLLDLWSIFKKCWWLMLAVLVVVSIALYAVMNALYEPQYTANVGIWALKSDGEGQNNNTSGNYYDMVIATQLVNDYKLLATSNEVLGRVIAANNWNLTIDDFREMIEIKHESNTRVLYLSVTTLSAETAKTATESWAKIFCDYITELRGEPMVVMIGSAELPEKPSNPISILKILLIAFVAAVVVYGIYFVRFIMDDKINNDEDVKKYLDLNVLGAIPNKHQLSRRREKYGYYAAGTRSGAARNQ